MTLSQIVYLIPWQLTENHAGGLGRKLGYLLNISYGRRAHMLAKVTKIDNPKIWQYLISANKSTADLSYFSWRPMESFLAAIGFYYY